MVKQDKFIKETEEEIEIDFYWFWRRRFHCVVLLLLITIITLQFIDEPLIDINIEQKQECPKIVCEDVTVNCKCQCLKGTVVEEQAPRYWNDFNLSDNITVDWVDFMWGINTSLNPNECEACWIVTRKYT